MGWSSKDAQLPAARVFFYNSRNFCWLPGDGTTQMAACPWRLLKWLFWMHLNYLWALFNPLKPTLGSLMIFCQLPCWWFSTYGRSWGGGGVLVEIWDLHVLIYLWRHDALLCQFPTTGELCDHGGCTTLTAKQAVLLRRKCSQAVHPTHTFSSRQPQSKSLPSQTTSGCS